MNESAKDNQNVGTVLFLCSGNYYRSRFAEEYFNHAAAARKIPWEADSAGLNLNLNNSGPISNLVLERLEELGISPSHGNRFPRAAESFDLARADVVVAMSHKEHYGLMRHVFPKFVTSVRFWDVEDIDEMRSADALAAIEHHVGDLLDELQNGLAGMAGMAGTG